MPRRPTSKARLAALGLVALPALLLSSALVAPRARTFKGGPASAPQSSAVRFAAIGDFGDDRNNGTFVAAVAKLVKGWDPEFVITLGDNNYNCGKQGTIAANVSKHYGDFIRPGDRNRFFPVLGNHDWGHSGTGNTPHPSGFCREPPNRDCNPVPKDLAERLTAIKPYRDLFDLPAANGERYYDFVRGPVHFFALDSDCNEPDGITPTSAQATWLRRALENSTARYKVVYMHHPPFSSGHYGSQKELQWDFRRWGATLVMAGHEHSYERLYVDCLPYIVNGSGGHGLRPFDDRKRLPSSLARHGKEKGDNYGAMLIEADERKMTLQFFRWDGTPLDGCSIRGAGGGDIGKQCWEP